MTEKRFTSDIHRIYDNNEEIACADTMGDAETIVDRLNEQDVRIKELESENKMLKTTKRWSFNGGVIVGTDICEEGIPHTNRSIVTHLNMYERKIRELEEENKQLKKENERLKMTEKYYVVRYYQENGFASTEYVIKTFKSKKKADFYAKFMNKEDEDAMYFVYEREFDDGDIE